MNSREAYGKSFRFCKRDFFRHRSHARFKRLAFVNSSESENHFPSGREETVRVISGAWELRTAARAVVRVEQIESGDSGSLSIEGRVEARSLFKESKLISFNFRKSHRNS